MSAHTKYICTMVDYSMKLWSAHWTYTSTDTCAHLDGVVVVLAGIDGTDGGLLPLLIPRVLVTVHICPSLLVAVCRQQNSGIS